MDEWIMQRYELARDRLTQVVSESAAPPPFEDFFRRMAGFLLLAQKPWDPSATLEECQRHNHRLYEDLIGEAYERSYGNPAYACEQLGDYGQDFSFLYKELRGVTAFAAEGRIEDVTILLELFLQIYATFCQEELPEPAQTKACLISYAEDYCSQMVEDHVARSLDPSCDWALRIIMDSDLEDLRYLYRYGEYISENELQTAGLLNSLSGEEIDRMAGTFVEGYRLGFEIGRKDLSKKKTVEIRYHLGFERMIRAAVIRFRELGLEPVIRRYSVRAVTSSEKGKVGFVSSPANPQFDYDHRQDDALFLTTDFVQKKLRALQCAYERYEQSAAEFGGPAVLETFGEKPFSPKDTPGALKKDEAMAQLSTRLMTQTAGIINRYIKGEERSFTIIAWPLPGIGPDYQAVFHEVTRINTLDNEVYRQIQQKLIDALDSCEWVSVKGRNGNETDLIIHLHELKHPVRQTNFENCLADVNIPLGEVFTSPVLAGTGGILHVSGVYLNGLFFKDLKLTFDCGQVIDYSCKNFKTKKENRRYIEENILFHHQKIPMGEFAIGTNTVAYAMARRFGIEDRLPILIAEKMGPHFALGDTCYSYQEDLAVYNPDGKEIIARENELSALRNEDPELAYYGCHTDITLPYDELDSICVINDDGDEIPLISGGRFVLPGTEALNDPL